MNKSFRLLFGIISCFIVLNCACVLAQTKTVKASYFPRRYVVQKVDLVVPNSYSITKLQDGKILLASREFSAIFNEDMSSYKIGGGFNEGLNFAKGTLLNDGRVLFINPMMAYPSEKFNQQIFKLISNKLYKEKLKNFDITKLSEEQKRKISHDLWQEYRQLPEVEKEKIYLPYIKKDTELFSEYNLYLTNYQKSMYAQIFDPKTMTFSYAGKVNIRRSDFNALLLDNGNVIIAGGYVQREPTVKIGVVDSAMTKKAGKIEIFKPETGEFTLIENLEITDWRYYPAFVLKDGNVYNLSGELYNPHTNTISKTKKLDGFNFIKLSDDRIVFNGQETDSVGNKMTIKIYDPHKNEIQTLGKLLVPRGDNFDMVLLNDNNLLIYGGTNIAQSGPFAGKVNENRLEIFNLNTKQQKKFSKRYKGAYPCFEVLLNNGSTLFSTNDNLKIFLFN